MAQEPKTRERSFIRDLVPNQRPTREQVLWGIRIAVVLVTVLGILTLIGLPFGITLWLWVKLLIVPAVIAAGGVWFNRQQRERELLIAVRRAQDEALEAYLDQMSDLLIPRNDRPSLYDKDSSESVRSAARARTLSVLPRLNGDRKARVVQFLYESGLISGNHPVLRLKGADLSRGNLREADLDVANLYKANLSGANMSRADLSEANLSEADLSGADLSEANLSAAYLSRADLSGANLTDAKVTWKQLVGPKLSGTTMPDGQILRTDSVPNRPTFADWCKSQDRRENGENGGPS